VNKRTKFLLGIGVIAALVIGFQVAAYGVHDLGVFELEGDAVDDTAVAGDDWEKVFANTDSADETAFVQEPDPNDSFFTGGGSKDPEDIPAWKWKDETGGLPDKSNLTNSFAASYTTTDGQELLYFGADRFDGSGDAAIAFWFLQDEVAQTPASGSSGTFTGEHQNGDVLVISNFSNGGNVSTITVYEWDDTCDRADDNNPTDGECAAANLRVVTTSATADCSTVGEGDLACAIVNNAEDDNSTRWPFDNKDQGTANNTEYLPGELFEGGINLTALELDDQCFATVLTETRTSTSPTSVLKDFTVGELGSCESGITTSPVLASDNTGVPAGGVSPGIAVKDSANITVSGISAWDGTLQFFLCGPLAAGALCETGGTPVGSPIAVDETTTQPIYSAEVNTAANPLGPGRYCFRGFFDSTTDGVPDSTDADESECFTVRQPTSITTAQEWLPQDTATVTGATGGTVVFTLYENGTCTPPATGTPVTFTDNSAPYRTENTTYRTESTTISWKATFTPTDPNIDPSTSGCEVSNLTITN
jgi:hypothetical protein